MKSESKKLNLGHRVDNLLGALRDRDRKPIIQMASEFIGLSVQNRGFATHYFTAFLYKKSVNNCADYLSLREIRRLQEEVCSDVAIDISHNKLLFHTYFESKGVPLPRLLAYNFKNALFTMAKGSWSNHDISHQSMFNPTALQLIEQAPNCAVFVKPIKASCGEGAQRFSLDSNHPTEKTLLELHRHLVSGSSLIQESLVQHPLMAQLNSTSLNTIRIDTVRLTGESPEVISALIRIGRNGSVVDNIAAGGIFVGIDIETGRLKANGLGKLSKDSTSYLQHPDTGVVFQDVTLPFFSEVRQLALDSAALMPQSLVGWDIAVTSDGPVLIEGNAIYYDMQLSDIAYGGYRRNTVFRKIASRFNGKCN